MPVAKVTAATPTTRAPRVIVARDRVGDPGRDAEARERRSGVGVRSVAGDRRRRGGTVRSPG